MHALETSALPVISFLKLCPFDYRPALMTALAPARWIRNSDSSGTGRPVAPLASPLKEAVPAMSRCAHLYALVNRSRKHAAVTAPAGRPPILAISAKLLLSCVWYSSNNGICQTRSPVSVLHL